MIYYTVSLFSMYLVLPTDLTIYLPILNELWGEEQQEKGYLSVLEI